MGCPSAGGQKPQEEDNMWEERGGNKEMTRELRGEKMSEKGRKER